MKKIIVLFASFLLLSQIYGQNSQKSSSKADTSKPWNVSSFTSITVAQTALHNWAAGGENSFSFNAISNIQANYNKGVHSWNNTINLAYGMLKQQSKGWTKTDDRMEFNSQYGLHAFKRMYYTALLNFRSQFAPGYDYKKNDTVKISDFLSPGYLIFSAGMSYQSKDKSLNIFGSFVSGKMTIVLDSTLSAKGAFGVQPGKKVRYEVGAYVRITYNKQLTKNIMVNTQINLFSNYLHNPQNIDVNINALFVYKATKYLTFNIKTQAIYDDDTKILVDPLTGHKGPRLQLLEIFGFGLSFKLPD
jgi:hypothetical protein